MKTLLKIHEPVQLFCRWKEYLFTPSGYYGRIPTIMAFFFPIALISILMKIPQKQFHLMRFTKTSFLDNLYIHLSV